MDLALLIDKYLSDKLSLIADDDNFNISGESLVSWSFANIPCPTMEELLALQPEVEAENTKKLNNEQSLKFLNESDFKIIRHLDQQNLGIATSLTAEEFQELLHERQMARESIN